MAEKEKSKEMQSRGDAEPEAERSDWAHPMEFILSCLGFAVGLGNVWRFPYLVYSNGGGAFLIPYVLMLLLIGLPVFFIELSSGQMAGAGPVGVFEASPIWQGIGWGMIFISLITSVYYNMVIGWSMYYFGVSFSSVLPWSGCNNYWNTAYCYTSREGGTCEAENGTWFNQTCFNQTFISAQDETREKCNETVCEDYVYNEFKEWYKNISNKLVSSTEEYFNRKVLDRSDAIEDAGYLKWDLVLVLFAAWVLCWLCIVKGIRSSGKAVYFTALFPYLVLVILFFRGVTLDGAIDGIKFYLEPDWDILRKPKVWADAAGQIFFSLSIGMGGLMCYASYNKFHNNIFRDTLIVGFANSLTSFFAGFVIFSILGFMAKELGKEVKDVVSSGSGLAFVAYPEAVLKLPPSQLWAVMFFLMLISLGLDSQFASLEAIQTTLMDFYPNLRKRKWLVSGIISIIMFLLGLSMCTRSGLYWLDLMGYYSGSWSLILIGLMEAIAFGWFYGAGRLLSDISYMTGFPPPPYWYWWVCWVVVSPLIMFGILIFSFVEFVPLSFDGYVVPMWAQLLGWLMAVTSVLLIPVIAVYNLWKTYQDPTFDGLDAGTRLFRLISPSKRWGRKGLRPGQNFRSVYAPGQGSGPEHANGYSVAPPAYNQAYNQNNKGFEGYVPYNQNDANSNSVKTSDYDNPTFNDVCQL